MTTSADRPIRVACFPDSFHEVNGVAHTSRHFEAFARRRGLPFLCVRAGNRRERLQTIDNVTTLELPRGPLSIPLDKGLRFDPGWIAHFPATLNAVRAFRPDMIHVTGPSECGLLGAWVARWLHIPLAASWHTNLHEYAASRSRWWLDRLEPHTRIWAARAVESAALGVACVLYRWAQVLFAPNPELCTLLETKTGRPCHLMQRGVDTQLFSPEWRRRSPADRDFVLGYVGRMSIEKNVALLVQIQQELERRGLRGFRFRIVGQGAHEAWLRDHLPRAEFTGVLRGEALARAYADMDVFVFPSHTDTFGNVVLEALASGVPAVVTPDGGPKMLVRHGQAGFVTDDGGFPQAIATILENQDLHAAMRCAARADAMRASWDSVFEKVYDGYRSVLRSGSLINALV
ncbi:MAG TPA: glycosyltransferase [Acidobacteriaceae bacterium]|nr:glycosyltransferase [Acidobacteriaceae bacterium]